MWTVHAGEPEVVREFNTRIDALMWFDTEEGQSFDWGYLIIWHVFCSRLDGATDDQMFGTEAEAWTWRDANAPNWNSLIVERTPAVEQVQALKSEAAARKAASAPQE